MHFRGEANKEAVSSIAIVGAALRFPGAADPSSFHELVLAGHRMFRGVPRLGAGVAARRLLAAETATAALADVPASGRPGRAGVIIAELPEPGGADVTGWVAGRLGLARHDGIPRYSCSLRAVAAACALLSAGQFDLVLAGGVSTGIDPAWLAYRVHRGALADGDVRVYDTCPTGTLPGEGCGVVALMRTPDAHAAGLGAYAEIAGWEAADGITAPATAIRDAYLRSGIDPADVRYVEGHGAATAVDDLAELTALLDVLAPRHDGTPGGCALGSVAANIGDTRGAAGIAALLKTALAMTAGVIPPTTGCVRPHHLLRAGAAPFRLPAAPEPWPEAAARLAAVNSLGTSGIAGVARSGPVHIVLRREESGRPAGRRRRGTRVRRPAGRSPDERDQRAVPPGDDRAYDMSAFRWGAHRPPRPRAPLDSAGTGGAQRADTSTGRVSTGDSGSRGLTVDTLNGGWVIAVRGTDREDLAVTLDTIAMAAARLPGVALGEFAVEMASIRAAAGLRARAAIVARDPAQLAGRAAKAAAALRERPPGTRPAGPGAYASCGARGRVALLFPGLVSTGIEHSAVLSASMATLGTAERLGLRPRLAVGYSFGEIAGLAWAGALTFGEVARLAAQRAEIIRATPGRAAMARVHASPRTVAGLCSGTGLTVAVHEGPVQHVVAGQVSDIRELPRRAADLGADVEVLSIARALHTPAMAPSAAPMRAVIDGLRFTGPRRRLISTVTGLDITSSANPASLIAGQLTRPALLSGALALARADADLILLTARDPALAAVAGNRDRVPVIQAPLDQRPGTVLPSVLAAFFAAGAIDSVLPFLPGGVRAPGGVPAGGPRAAGNPVAAGNLGRDGAAPGQAAGEFAARA